MDELKVLNFEGGLGIQNVGAFAEKLKDLLAQKCNIIVNLSNIDALDLSCIQVLLAAKKTAQGAMLTIQLANQISQEAAFAFYVCGISKSPDLSGKEISKILDDLSAGAH